MSKDQIFWNITFTLIYAILIAASALVLRGDGRLPKSIPALDLIVLTLAVFRFTRLLVYDSVTRYIREYLERFKNGPRRTLADLLSCPWCTGIWVALPATFFYFLSSLSWYPLFLFALAGAGTYLQLIIIRISRRI